MPLPSDRLAALVGLIPAEVGEALAALAADAPADEAIVEVGSYMGKSTCYLAAGAREGHGAHVFAVDPWDTPGNAYDKHGYSRPVVREEFERQVKSLRLWSRVTPVQAFSNDAAADWDGPPVGLLYIDGDHSAAAIRTDLAAWAPHLAERHVVAFDDLDTPKNPGVRVVVEEMMAAGYMLTVMADRLAVCRP